MAGSIGDRFKEIRKMLEFNQRKFASELGISQTHISSIELGKDQPSSSLIRLVCMQYNLNEDWLGTGVGTPIKETANIEIPENNMLEAYSALRVRLEREIREASAEDAALIISAFDSFVSTLTISGRIKEANLPLKEKHDYIRSIRKVQSSLWKLIARVTLGQRSLPSIKDARGWWAFKKDSEELLERMQSSAKNAANLFLSTIDDTMRL